MRPYLRFGFSLLLLTLAGVASLPSGGSARPAPAALVGDWSIERREARPQHVDLRLTYSRHTEAKFDRDSWSNSVTLKSLPISEERLIGPIAPVRFTVSREPGSFVCVGTAGLGSGAGQFVFSASDSFSEALAARGIGRPALTQSLELAMAGTTLSFIDDLNRFVGTPSIADLVTAAEHGVGPEYVAGLDKLGYHIGSLHELVGLRDHGVTLEYVGSLKAAGYANLAADELVRLVDHGVQPSLMRSLKAAGYGNPSAVELVRLADHGVQPSFIRDLAKLGYPALSTDAMVQLVDHGVNAAFIERLQSRGYTNISVPELIRFRDRGI